MISKEVIDIRKEVHVALKEIGVLGTADSNIIWKKQVPSVYDTVYKQDVNKEYVEYELPALVIKLVSKDELTKNLGLDTDKAIKMFISGIAFDTEEIVPKEADRVVYLDITYNVLKVYPIHLSEMDLMYKIYLEEAPFSAQTAEYREEQDPYYQIDATISVASTNVSGVNNALYTTTQALVIGKMTQPFNFTALNNKLILAVSTLATPSYITSTLSIASNSYGTTEMLQELTALISASSLSGAIVAFISGNYACIGTPIHSVNAVISLAPTSYSAYTELGWTQKEYRGEYKLLLKKDTVDVYSDGDPLYGNA